MNDDKITESMRLTMENARKAVMAEKTETINRLLSTRRIRLGLHASMKYPLLPRMMYGESTEDAQIRLLAQDSDDETKQVIAEILDEESND